MNPVLTRSKPTRPRLSGEAITFLVAGAVGLALFLLLMPALRSPRVVDVTVENPTGSNVEVDVTRPGELSVLRVGAVEPGRTETFGSVLDQGDSWVIRFHAGVDQRRELVVTRAELERGRWMVSVPEGSRS